MLTVVALEADAQGLPNVVEASQSPKTSWLWVVHLALRCSL